MFNLEVLYVIEWFSTKLAGLDWTGNRRSDDMTGLEM